MFRLEKNWTELDESLLSPNPTCNNISAGKLKEQHSIVAADANKLLVRLKDNKPGAYLETIGHVLYMEPLNIKEKSGVVNKIAVPVVARIPQISSAHRWHQRLVHTGQQTLKKTAETSYGREGINYFDIITCETCHLH